MRGPRLVFQQYLAGSEVLGERRHLAAPGDSLQPSVLAFPSRRPGFWGGNLHAVHGKFTAPGSNFDGVHRLDKFLNCAVNPAKL